jgi:transposase
LHNLNLLFITRVPIKFKEAKELLKELKDEELTTIDENYSYKSVVLKHFGINAKWVVYKSNLSNKKEVGTLNKVLLKNSSNELKEANRLKKRTFYCTEDAVSAYNKLKQDSKFIKLTEYKIIQKPKFQSKGRPKKDEKPVSFEYYLDYYTYMDIDTTQEQRNLKCGYFILATNDLTISAKELLDEYKTQQRVERGFRFLKSPEFLSDAIFLKTEKRIEAMLMIMTLCLLVYSALEYKIRQELKQRNLTIPNQLNKEVQNPTTRWIFQIFFAIHIVTVAKTFQQVVGINELHLKILNLLGDRYKRFYGIDGGGRSEKNIKSGAE